MAAEVQTDDYINLCTRCPLSECAETDPRCLIQIAVRRENEVAGEVVRTFKARPRRNEIKRIRVVDWDEAA